MHLVAAVLALPALAVADGQQGGRHACLNGDTISVTDPCFTFHIPHSWVETRLVPLNNIHLEAASLQAVENATGEWDSEYARVANSVFPFRACVAHLGEEGWGAEGVGFGDLQMRVYCLHDWGGAKIDEAAQIGLATAKKISEKASLAKGEARAWSVHEIEFPVWYGDYGGIAVVDVYSKRVGQYTVALVFMYAKVTSDRSDLTEILNSFALPNNAPQPTPNSGRG